MDKTWIASFIILVIGLGLALFLLGDKGHAHNYDGFAMCLSENGATMYGANWCSHCQNQKHMFGDSFEYVNYVECPDNQDLCIEKGIEGYPTWIINGMKYPGEHTLEELSQLTGCSLDG